MSYPQETGCPAVVIGHRTQRVVVGRDPDDLLIELLNEGKLDFHGVILHRAYDAPNHAPSRRPGKLAEVRTIAHYEGMLC
jgi:hypothetical protein